MYCSFYLVKGVEGLVRADHLTKLCSNEPYFCDHFSDDNFALWSVSFPEANFHCSKQHGTTHLERVVSVDSYISRWISAWLPLKLKKQQLKWLNLLRQQNKAKEIILVWLTQLPTDVQNFLCQHLLLFMKKQFTALQKSHHKMKYWHRIMFICCGGGSKR